MRVITDIFRFCAENTPRWNTISISGYHIREAGATAAQEVGFTLANGIAYVQAAISAGMPVDDFAPQLSFFFNAHNQFFEEAAKYRAARRIWARIMKERFGAQKPASQMLRFHTQTAGSTLTAQQPDNNIIRTAYQAMAAVLGGTQSLHTNSMDETLALPSEKAVTIALRTQQILAHETGVTNTVDPLAGSYFVESLTNKLEEEAEQYFDRIDSLGGVIPAIEIGFFQREIADAAYRYQRELDQREKIIVGVNAYVQENEKLEIPILEIPKEVELKQRKRIAEVKANRSTEATDSALSELHETAMNGGNLMPSLLKATRAYVTLGEMCDTLKEVFGVYDEPLVF